MKKKLLFSAVAAFGLIASVSAQQVNETVSIGAGYANEVYYNLQSGNKQSVTRDNWDLAFASDGIGFGSSAIRINDGTGTELYIFSSDTSDWSTLDTTGFNWTANRVINADTTWTEGAFNNFTPTSGFDLGWGEYSTITHIVSANRIFVLKLANGTYKKIIIDRLQSGTYHFRYADVNGSNEVAATVTKNNHSGQNFGYYSIQNQQELSREPGTSTWDLLFTKYVTDLGGGMLYGVTGVLANINAKVAQVNNVPDVNTVSHTGQNYTFDIGTIGYDWKYFNTTTFQFEIEDSLVYFVETAAQDIYKIIFTGFGGSANGNFEFTKEFITSVGVDELANQKTFLLNVYPNPARENINITYNGLENQTQIHLYDLTGKEVLTQVWNNGIGLNQEQVDVSQLQQGVYFLTLVSGNKTTTQKIIIQ